MIPVRKSQDDFRVVEVFVWIFVIVNNERTTESIWVLASYVRMIPVGSWLVDLYHEKQEVSTPRSAKSSEMTLGRDGIPQNHKRTFGLDPLGIESRLEAHP